MNKIQIKISTDNTKSEQDEFMRIKLLLHGLVPLFILFLILSFKSNVEAKIIDGTYIADTTQNIKRGIENAAVNIIPHVCKDERR